MAAGFQTQRPFRKRLGRHRKRFPRLSSCGTAAFQWLIATQWAQNYRNRGPVAKVGLILIVAGAGLILAFTGGRPAPVLCQKPKVSTLRRLRIVMAGEGAPSMTCVRACGKALAADLRRHDG
jgi:hypothetical protein